MIIKASDRVSRIGSYAFAEVDKEVSRLEKQGVKAKRACMRRPLEGIVEGRCD